MTPVRATFKTSPAPQKMEKKITLHNELGEVHGLTDIFRRIAGEGGGWERGEKKRKVELEKERKGGTE